MTKKLTKGSNIVLPTRITELAVGLSWEAPGVGFDLDAWTFMISGGRVPSDEHFVFFNNTASPCGTVCVSEDNQQGGSEDEDDEVVTVQLADVPAMIDRIVFIVNIHEGRQKGQNFSQLDNAAIRLYDRSQPGGSQELARYNLATGDVATETSLIFGELYRHQTGWKFRAIAQGSNSGPAMLAREFGVDVADPDPVAPAAPLAQANSVHKLPPTPAINISKGNIDLDKPGESATIAVTPEMEFSLYWAKKNKDLGLILLVTHKDGRKHSYDWRNLSDSLGEVTHHGDRVCGGCNLREYATLRFRRDTNIAAVAIVAYSELSNGSGSFRAMGAHAVIDDGSGTRVTVDLNKGGTFSYHTVIATIIVNSNGSLRVNRVSRFSAVGSENRPEIDQYGNLSMNTGPVVFK